MPKKYYYYQLCTKNFLTFPPLSTNLMKASNVRSPLYETTFTDTSKQHNSDSMTLATISSYTVSAESFPDSHSWPMSCRPTQTGPCQISCLRMWSTRDHEPYSQHVSIMSEYLNWRWLQSLNERQCTQLAGDYSTREINELAMTTNRYGNDKPEGTQQSARSHDILLYPNANLSTQKPCHFQGHSLY